MIEDLTESFTPVCNTITPTILILTKFLKMPQGDEQNTVWQLLSYTICFLPVPLTCLNNGELDYEQ